MKINNHTRKHEGERPSWVYAKNRYYKDISFYIWRIISLFAKIV
jgi:hypothetical protein